MLLYRGIAVPELNVADAIRDIRSRGLVSGQGHWSYSFLDLKPRLADLWQLPVLTYAITKPAHESPPWVAACADATGASYYANNHNRTDENNAPLLITFEANMRDVIIDGRDFLYTLFQFGDPDRARPMAELLFGSAIRRYLDRAWSTEDQIQRICLCDLAVQDDAVIEAHARNTTVIEGRYGTRYCNAFLVRLPIPAGRIVDVAPVKDLDTPECQITLRAILESR